MSMFYLLCWAFYLSLYVRLDCCHVWPCRGTMNVGETVTVIVPCYRIRTCLTCILIVGQQDLSFTFGLGVPLNSTYPYRVSTKYLLPREIEDNLNLHLKKDFVVLLMMLTRGIDNWNWRWLSITQIQDRLSNNEICGTRMNQIYWERFEFHRVVD